MNLWLKLHVMFLQLLLEEIETKPVPFCVQCTKDKEVYVYCMVSSAYVRSGPWQSLKKQTLFLHKKNLKNLSQDSWYSDSNSNFWPVLELYSAVFFPIGHYISHFVWLKVFLLSFNS